MLGGYYTGQYYLGESGLLGPYHLSHSTDALLKSANTLTHSTDGLLRFGGTLSHTTDTLLREEPTVFHSTDTFLKNQLVIVHTTDSLITTTPDTSQPMINTQAFTLRPSAKRQRVALTVKRRFN